MMNWNKLLKQSKRTQRRISQFVIRKLKEVRKLKFVKGEVLSLFAGLLGSMLAGKGINRAGERFITAEY